MTSRKALLIGAPDAKIPGVRIDIENLKNFLISPNGGLWYEDEITILFWPSIPNLVKEIEKLKDHDYSFIFFAGHGYHSIEKDSTIVNIDPHQKIQIDSAYLRNGALKHTLILDCCRKLESDSNLIKSLEANTLNFSESKSLTPWKCRLYFDNVISKCDTGLVVMNSCAINQTAGESASEGGYYTSSLINSANSWTKIKLQNINLSNSHDILSTQDCHNIAAVNVAQLSGERQNPSIEILKPRNKFPFAVVA